MPEGEFIGAKAPKPAWKPAAGEAYFPEGMAVPRWYAPTGRGLEGKIGEKLNELRRRNEEARGKKP